MGLFKFISGAVDRLVNGSVDARMQKTADVIEQTLIPRIHVVSGYMRSTSGVTYRQSDKTIQVHFDAPYALIELARGGSHDALNPALQAGAKLWNGSFEVHFPNALVGRGEAGLGRMRQHEVRLHHALGGGRGGLASRTRIHSRRWHRWAAETPTDPATPIL